MHEKSTLPTTPGALIGYRKTGHPIYLVAGGSGEGEGGQGNTGQNGGTGEGSQTGGQPPANDPPGQQGNGQTGTDAQDVSTLPDWAQKLITETRAEAGKARTTAKATAAQEARAQMAQEIGKALGLVKDEPVDPEALAKQLGDEQSRARAAVVELAVHKSAGKHGADPEALADSRTFVSTLEALDPTAEDFPAKLGEAIRAAVKANPKLAAAGGQAPPPPRSGGQHTGGTGGADPGSMDMDEYVKHRRERDK